MAWLKKLFRRGEDAPSVTLTIELIYTAEVPSPWDVLERSDKSSPWQAHMVYGAPPHLLERGDRMYFSTKHGAE